MIRTSEQLDEINAALAAFHQKDVTVTKDGTGNFNNTFASLAANINAADKPAAECGLSVVQLMTYLDSQHGIFDTLTTRINHSSGQWMEGVQIMHLPKEDPQGQGSAMTYGRRYNYQGAYGLAAEDDDAQSASDSIGERGSTAAGRTPPRGSRSSGQNKNNAGLIRKIASDNGLDAAWLRAFTNEIVGREVEKLDDLTETEDAVVLNAIRAKERELKERVGE